MNEHVRLLSCACEPERATTDEMIRLSEIRRRVWPHLPDELRAELGPQFTAIAVEIGRVDGLRVRAMSAEKMVKEIRRMLSGYLSRHGHGEEAEVPAAIHRRVRRVPRYSEEGGVGG